MPVQHVDPAKVNEYFRVIEERILGPIQTAQVQSSCTATLLLIFSAIDSLGTLMHPKANAKVTDRINCFLDFMNGDYKRNKSQLVDLRHSLMHSAINIESYLSRTTTGTENHLKKIGSNGYIYINTLNMIEDFESAFARFKSLIKSDTKFMIQVSNRLEWEEEDYPIELITNDEPMPSPPPPVQFILTKGKIRK